jgi:hypothetical protein
MLLTVISTPSSARISAAYEVACSAVDILAAIVEAQVAELRGVAFLTWVDEAKLKIHERANISCGLSKTA